MIIKQSVLVLESKPVLLSNQLSNYTGKKIVIPTTKECVSYGGHGKVKELYFSCGEADSYAKAGRRQR